MKQSSSKVRQEKLIKRMTKELREKYIKEVEERIAQESQTQGLKMVRFIHEEPAQPEMRFDRRKRWWGWEI